MTSFVLSTLVFRAQALGARELDLAAAHGFSAIEVVSAPGHFDVTVPSDVAQVQAALASSGVSTAALAVPPGAAPTAIEIAQSLNCPLVVIRTRACAGARLPAAGGAYLRLLPAGLMEAALRDAASRKVPAMCYVHPWEIDPEQPRIPVGALTRIRHYGGLGRVEERLNKLMSAHRFTSVQKYLAAA